MAEPGADWPVQYEGQEWMCSRAGKRVFFKEYFDFF
jgi:hypothetical protein